MATGSLAPLVRYLRHVTNPAAAGDIADAELLSRFTLYRDEAAFTTLVRRHGPMVLAVCRRVVRDGHAAEDAFQATFLVLARKAASLTRPELLGNWLHGVAYRTATKARIEIAKRRSHEARAVRPQEIGPSDESEWQDLRAILDEEVNRLPERYRVPVVLCYLQGQTNAEAARRLGCSRGTVATLLARARDKLRRRLLQRGVGLAVGVALTEAVRGNAAPLALQDVTVKAAVLLAAGQTQAVGALAAQAVALAKGVSKGMLMEKLKIPAAILMMTALVGAGVGVGAYRAGAQDAEVAESPKEAKPRPASKTQRAPMSVAAVAEPPKNQKAMFRTENFIVTASTVEIARQVGQAAEHNRKALALLWLNKELATWTEPCPVRVTIAEATGSASEFSFQDGVVSRGGIRLEGPIDRIFADLLPHEMTHTILAEWRGRPLPRWADEGAAMLSESAVSRERYEQVWETLLATTKNELPLSELLSKLNYPKDVRAFYAQSLSLTDFLVAAKGRRKFLAFVAQGQDNSWDKAANAVYGYKSVGALERAWLDYAWERHCNFVEKNYKRPLGSGSVPGPKVAAAPEIHQEIEKRLPSGTAPVQALVALDPDGRLRMMAREVTYYEPVTRTATAKDGQRRSTTSYQEKRFYPAAYFDFNTVQVHDAKGRKIDEKELRKRLQKETVVLVSADTQPVDPLHLRLYKEDTLVFVLPSPLLPPMFPREPIRFPQSPISMPPSAAEPVPATPVPPPDPRPEYGIWRLPYPAEPVPDVPVPPRVAPPTPETPRAIPPPPVVAPTPPAVDPEK